MSQENVERYLRTIDAWNRGALDEWLDAAVTPGWEMVATGAFPGLASVYRGRDGAIEMWNGMRGPWEGHDLHIEVERIQDLGESILVLTTMRASGGKSGVDVVIKMAHVVSYRSGDEHLHNYANWAEALKAVGLEE